jgi:hypothetical protein
VNARRTIVTTASVGFGALLVMLGMWQAVDAEACASSDLELAYCQAATDAP